MRPDACVIPIMIRLLASYEGMTRTSEVSVEAKFKGFYNCERKCSDVTAHFKNKGNGGGIEPPFTLS